jgi:hypothetical protein
MTPKTLRGALKQIEKMLTKQSYSGDLWDVLTALRGPDSRNRKLKYATTALVRSAAFPSRPCEDRSVFGKDSKKLAARRRKMYSTHEDFNHFREHISEAFAVLGLSLFEENVWKK